MNSTYLQAQISLSLLAGIGPKKAAHLLTNITNIEDVFTLSEKQLADVTSFPKAFIRKMGRKDALVRGEAEANYIVKNNVNTHFFTDANFPRRLKQCVDAPILLYSKGNFEINPMRSLSIVGTRAATNYGKSLCDELVNALIGANIQVISGMAYGIDIHAHQACVQNKIETIGVLGHGLDRLYPSIHNKVAQSMFENGGLITEYLPGTNPDREHFPMRNRIVAGMSDAIIVVESKRTGGSLITANFGNDYNRDVFAFPGNIGSIYSEGCNRIIQEQKAHLLLNGTDFLKQMNWLEDPTKVKEVQRSCFVELTEDEELVVSTISQNNSLHIDSIALNLKKPISEVNVLLFHLEMKGVVKVAPGKNYSLL